jgi:5,6,7,8-tetrahydromethanopterin hydro-lyase
MIEGIIPRDQVNDLCIIRLVWIDPGCAKEANTDLPFLRSTAERQ